MTVAIEVTTTCPACRDGVTSQRVAYAYAKAYLCANHLAMWKSEDSRWHAALGCCPHFPKACTRCEELT